MKQFFSNNKLMGALVLVVLSLSACAKKDGASVASAGRATATGTTSQVTQTVQNACGSNIKGRIYDPAGSANFERQVKGLLSASIDPSSFGTISGNVNDPTTGVDVYASIKFDYIGAIVAAESTLQIKVFDSYVGQVVDGKVIREFDITFSKAASGQINRNTRQFQATFTDEYGDVILSGAYNDSIAQGTVYYQNRQSVSSSYPSNGTLGTFTIPTCFLIK